jgi:hypothetical protein
MPTDTSTTGPTATFTSTPTATATLAPDYTLIDDFANTGGGTSDSSQIYVITDQNNVIRNGYWYDATDTTAGSSAVTNFSASGAGSPDTYALECSGTLAAQGSYADFGFNFINSTPVTTYDATVGSRYTGIMFYAKAKTVPCGGEQPLLVDLVDNATVANHYVAVPLTTSWQAVTIFYNQALNSAGSLPVSTSLEQVTFDPQNLGEASYAYDFLVTDIQFVTATPPSPSATLPAANVIDDFVNGSNQMEFNPAGGSGTAPGVVGTGGYWFDYDSSNSMCPADTKDSAGNVDPFFLITPGNPVVSPSGIPSFCADINNIGTGSADTYEGMGFGFSATSGDFVNLYNYTSIVYYVKSSDSVKYTFMMNDDVTEPSGCYGASLNQLPGLTTTGTWQAVTVVFNPNAAGYQLGSVTGTPGTNGCSATSSGNYNGTTGFTNHTLDVGLSGSSGVQPYGVGQVQFQPQGNTYDLEVSDVFLLP